MQLKVNNQSMKSYINYKNYFLIFPKIYSISLPMNKMILKSIHSNSIWIFSSQNSNIAYDP